LYTSHANPPGMTSQLSYKKLTAQSWLV